MGHLSEDLVGSSLDTVHAADDHRSLANVGEADDVRDAHDKHLPEDPQCDPKWRQPPQVGRIYEALQENDGRLRGCG